MAHRGRASRANKSTFHTPLGLVGVALEPVNLTGAGIGCSGTIVARTASLQQAGQSRDRRAVSGQAGRGGGPKAGQSRFTKYYTRFKASSVLIATL